MNKKLFLSLLVATLSLFISCKDEKNLDSCAYSFFVDVAKTGSTIPNLVSNINVWDMGNLFIDPKITSDYNIFEFVEFVQLMTATGGNESRDLFKKPLDRTVRDDYDFSRLIGNCRGILSLGAKPHLKLGNVPYKLSSRFSSDTYSVNIYSPDDYKEYYAYIRAIIEALVGEFGIEEVRTWHFGVYTEYENKEWFQGKDGTPESAATEFCKIYDWSVKAVEDVLGKNIWIGAHSMTMNEGLWDEAIFIKHCGEGTNWADGTKGTSISYLATSYYDSAPGKFSETRTLPGCISFLRETALKYGLEGLAYGVDEGRILGSTPGKDSDGLFSRTVGYTYMAAYDARLYGQMMDSGGNYLSSWHYLSDGLLGGNPSVSYHVARNVYGLAGKKRIEVSQDKFGNIASAEVKAYAGVDTTSGKISIMVYNFGNHLDYDSTATVRLIVKTGLARGRHRVQVRKVDDDCNWFDEWVRDRPQLGITDKMFRWSPDDACCIAWNIIDDQAEKMYLSRVSDYAKHSVLVPNDGVVWVNKDGQAVLDCQLAPNSVWFIDIEE